MKQHPIETLPQVEYPLPKPGLEALKHLRTVIERVPAERINVGRWHCGTYGCFAGWAALDHTFNAMGLSADSYGGPWYQERGGFSALRKLFEIDFHCSHNLFGWSTYEATRGAPAKTEFLRRLDDVIAEKEAAA